MPWLDPTTLCAYGLVAVVAGFVDTLAGGGGLITIPALLLGGLPPLQALGTNKLQGTFGVLTSSLSLLGESRLGARSLVLPFVLVLVGSALGATLVQAIDPRDLDILVPVVLSAIALYFIAAPRAGEVERQPRLGERPYTALVLPAIGFYDGFFGPGAGSFFALSGVGLRGWDLVRATASAKIFNLASNLAGLGIFVWHGRIVWPIGVAMALGQCVGARLGASVVTRRGARIIRPMIVVVSVTMLCRYAWQKGLLG